MQDDFGRVNLYPRFLDRGAREEPYQGRHGRRHNLGRMDNEEDVDPVQEEPEPPTGGSHIDLRI